MLLFLILAWTGLLIASIGLFYDWIKDFGVNLHIIGAIFFVSGFLGVSAMFILELMF